MHAAGLVGDTLRLAGQRAKADGREMEREREVERGCVRERKVERGRESGGGGGGNVTCGAVMALKVKIEALAEAILAQQRLVHPDNLR